MRLQRAEGENVLWFSMSVGLPHISLAQMCNEPGCRPEAQERTACCDVSKPDIHLLAIVA